MKSEAPLAQTCRTVKFSRTLFIMAVCGSWRSLLMKLMRYSHIGDRSIRYA